MSASPRDDRRPIGFATGYDRSLSVRDMAESMSHAEAAGFQLGFFSETIEAMRDSVSALAAFAMSTSELLIGCTQIARLRSPLIMAQTLASLDELAGGRLIVAVGACTSSHARRYGLPETDPVTALREWVTTIRGLLSGEAVSFQGSTVRFDGAALGWRPRRPSIPIWIPATSRTGLRLAGSLGDGVLLNAVCSPEYTANALAIVREGVEEAGKRWEDFQVAQIIVCSVEDDHAAAVEAVRWEVASKFDPLQMPFIAGPKMRVGEPYIRAEDLPRFELAFRSGGKEALMEAVPLSYIEGMTATGTEGEVAARVQAFRDAGVRIPILRPAARHQTAPLLELFAPGAVPVA